MLPTVSVEAVLIDPDGSVPPPRSEASMMGRRLGDVTLAALIHVASNEPSIQVALPEEVSSGDESDYL